MNEQTAPLSSCSRVPTEPYPGLRPFLDFESALLFGRERQVREVIAHLRQTQFVAVLGGSGSGKSSLIHAGVVPELRSFGIAGAGDLWLPMTCTPGTNVGREDGAARRHSPVTRLARRFAGLLRSRGNPTTDAQRVFEIADVFRQEAGFARLLDAYGSELAVAPGPDPAQARVLFVLDQFEEIFHPTNRGVTDASLLVERVLDHFFNPHPRCHVVLTLRSEHLNDCASFLELPDAINKSSYLIRRLDERELHDAIVGPAQRLLRLVARTRETAPNTASIGVDAKASALPREVVFEPAVLERLLRDVQAITHDPDHLPLLQHLLARLWEAALQREHNGLPVPSQINWADLVWATHAAAPGATLDDTTNALRACVQNWPEREYLRQLPAQRKLLDTLLCQLAFKDPNTGLYSQQRVLVQDGASLLGVGKSPEDLRALIAQGFLGSVDYMFWDDDDPSRVTLKVSHESFIRGWQRFRQLVDAESSRFEDFVGALRKCALWQANERTDIFLMDEGDLSRLKGGELATRLSNPKQRENWFRLLLVDRDGARLLKLEPQLDGFVAASHQRVFNRDRRLKKAAFVSRLAWGTAALSVFLFSAYSALIETPVTKRAMAALEANRLLGLAQAPAIQVANFATGSRPVVTAPAVMALRLEQSLQAAEFIDDAQSGRTTVTPQLSKGLLLRLLGFPRVRELSNFLTNLNTQVESSVNKQLRQILTQGIGVWRDAAPATAAAPGGKTLVLQTSCVAAAKTPGAGPALVGRVFVAAGVAPEGGLHRAVFVHSDTKEGQVFSYLRSAAFDIGRKHCEYGPVVTSGPLSQRPHAQFDDELRSFAATADPMDRVLVSDLDWKGLQADSKLQFVTTAVIDDPDLVAKIKTELGRGAGFGLRTVPSKAGRSLFVGGQALRAIWPYAAPLAHPQDSEFFTSLRAAAANGTCVRMAGIWQLKAEANPTVFENATHCFLIGVIGSAAGPAAATPKSYVAWVYSRPQVDEVEHLSDNPPVPLASIVPFAEVTAGDADWLVAEQGEFAGWLALRGKDAEGRFRMLGAPWSTCALWRLGKSLLPLNSAAASTTTTAAGVCEGHA
jgi:energy-coupling factor transporter ATP-binding protein EcfA2